MSDRPPRGSRTYRRLLREVAAAGLPSGPTRVRTVSEAELEGLPETARRYLRFMGVPGRPQHWSFRVRFTGRLRLQGRRWLPAEAWQYDSAAAIVRIFVMRLRIAGVLPMVGVDKYVRGRGRMVGTLLGLFRVVDGKGDELDTGELVTWLNDAVLLSPSFLLLPSVSWTEVDDESFDVSLEDRGRSVGARVFVDDRGAPRDFSTTDRYADVEGGLVRTRWTTPISDWLEVDGRPFPGPVSAIWHLPEGPMPYIEGRFDPRSIAYDVEPGS